MGVTDRFERKRFLQARNARAVFLRDLRARGLPAAETGLVFVDDPDGDLREWLYRRRQENPQEVELSRPEEGIELAKDWLRGRRDLVYCHIGDVGVLSGDAALFLANFGAFGFLGDERERDVVFSSPGLDSGFACVEFHGGYHAHAWEPEPGPASS